MNTDAPGTFPGLVCYGCPVVRGEDRGLVWQERGAVCRVFWTHGPNSGVREAPETSALSVPLLTRAGEILAAVALAEHLDLPEPGVWSDGKDEDGRPCWYLGEGATFGAHESADYVVPALGDLDITDDTETDGIRHVDAAALVLALEHFGGRG